MSKLEENQIIEITNNEIVYIKIDEHKRLCLGVSKKHAQLIVKAVAKEIIKMLKNGTRHCENCDSDWSKGCRCCRMTFVGLIQERYGVEDD